MGSFLEHTTRALAAFGVAALSLNAPAAMAQNSDASALSQSQYPTLSNEEAMKESEDRILLHFGNNFPEETKNGIIEALNDLNYNFTVAEGGPEGHMNLYINKTQGKKPFSPSEAIGYLGIVLEQNALHYKLSIPDQTLSPP